MYDYQPSEVRKHPQTKAPQFEIQETDNDSIFDRGYDSFQPDTYGQLRYVTKANTRIRKKNENEEEEKVRNSQGKNPDSDGSNSPFHKARKPPSMGTINIPLNEMINDIANKRGMSRLDELRNRDMHGT